MNRFFKNLFGTKTKTIRKAGFRPRLEMLEERKMMDADVSLGNGILEVEGTDSDDRILISYADNGQSVRVIIVDQETDEVVLDEDRDLYDDGELEITGIEVYGMDGGDLLENNTAIPSTLDGGAGNDLLFGGLGNDRLVGGADNDGYGFHFRGDSPGHDTVVEASNQDLDWLWFDAPEGPESGIVVDLSMTSRQMVRSGFVEITLSSATGIEGVFGTAYDDSIWGNSRDNWLSGYDGDDTLEGRTGDDKLEGGAGDDRFIFSGNTNLGGDLIDSTDRFADEGIDTLDFAFFGRAIRVDLSSSAVQTVSAGYLTLELTSGSLVENVSGTPYNDTIIGNRLDNEIYGYGGADILLGQGGVDWLFGGTGIDMLYGGSETDYLYGGSEGDLLLGQGGLDYLYGGTGADTLDGGLDGLVDVLSGNDEFGTADGSQDTFVFYHRRRYLSAITFVWVPAGEEAITGFESGVDRYSPRYI